MVLLRRRAVPLAGNCGNCGNLRLCTFPLCFSAMALSTAAPPNSQQRIHLPAPRRPVLVTFHGHLPEPASLNERIDNCLRRSASMRCANISLQHELALEYGRSARERDDGICESSQAFCPLGPAASKDPDLSPIFGDLQAVPSSFSSCSQASTGRRLVGADLKGGRAATGS